MDSGMIKLPDKKLTYDHIFKNFSTELIEQAKLIEFRVASSQPNIPTYVCAKQPVVHNETVKEYLSKNNKLKPKSVLSGIIEQKDQEMNPGERIRENRSTVRNMENLNLRNSSNSRSVGVGVGVGTVGLKTIDDVENDTESYRTDVSPEIAKADVEK